MRFLKYGLLLAIAAVVMVTVVFFLIDRSEKIAYRRRCGCEFNFPRHLPTLLHFLSTRNISKNEIVSLEHLPDEVRDVGVIRVYTTDSFAFFVLGEYQSGGKTIVNELVCCFSTAGGGLEQLKKLTPQDVEIYHAATMSSDNWHCWQHDWFDIRKP
jgi:hypothetical protein